MSTSICGADCTNCPMEAQCRGCTETDGCPFGVRCMVAQMIREGSFEAEKQRLMDEFNAMKIPFMDEVTELYALHAAYVNLEFPLPGGRKMKFWDDREIVLGAQLHKKGHERCYGLAANREYLMICEYGDNGEDPELVVLKRREV